jgi:hypothetical protein
MDNISTDSPMDGKLAYQIVKSLQIEIGQDGLEDTFKYLTVENLNEIWETVLTQTKGFTYDRIELDEAVPVSVAGRVSIVRQHDIQEALALFVQAVVDQIKQAQARE